MARLNRNKSEMMTNVLNNPSSKWMKRTKEIMEKYGIEERELIGPKEDIRSNIEEKIHDKFYQKMTQGRNDRSKLNFYLEGKGPWSPEKPSKYMLKLTRKQTHTIFTSRTRMMRVKGNYKNGYPNQTCRACKSEPESQTHVLEECTALHPRTPTANRNPEKEIPNKDNANDKSDTKNKIDNDITSCTTTKNSRYDTTDIFNEDTDQLKEISKRIEKIITELLSLDN